MRSKAEKLALRADATRRALTEALEGFIGADVDTAIEGGSIVATVTVADDAEPAAVKAVLNQYTLRWNLAVRLTSDTVTDRAPVSG